MYVYFYITIAICGDYINQSIGWIIICGFDLFKNYCASIQSHSMVHPKIYVHSSRFVAFCRDLVSDDCSPYFSIASLALGQSYNCHGASKAALTNMGNWSKCDTLICNNPWNSAKKTSSWIHCTYSRYILHIDKIGRWAHFTKTFPSHFKCDGTFILISISPKSK